MAEVGKTGGKPKKRKSVQLAQKQATKKPKPEKREKQDGAGKKEEAVWKKKESFSPGKKAYSKGGEDGKPKVILDRRDRKNLAEERKRKRKPNYELEKFVIAAWEKLRQRKLSPSDRAKMTTELVEKMKGKLAELAVSHTCSRVVQSCVKHCTVEERAAIFEELKPNCLPLAQNTYAHHLVNKMIEHGSREQKSQIVTSFYGHVVPLLRHPVASHVVEQAFQQATGAQKYALISEFYSPEHKVFKDVDTNGKFKKLPDLLSESTEAKRRSLLEHFALAIQPIIEKGIVDHSIVHRALFELLSCAPERLWADTVEQLSGPLLVRMMHTREGSLVAAKCISAGSAKERKKAVKALKEHVVKVAMTDHGYMVLLQIFESVDDTMLVRKTILSELMKDLKSLALHKNGSRVLIHFLAPKLPRYFHVDVITLLNEAASRTLLAAAGMEEEKPKEVTKDEETVENEGDGEVAEDKEEGGSKVKGVSKKDPEVRRWELLHGSGLDAALVDLCTENADELLRSRFGTDVLFEVCSGGADGLLWRSVSSKLSELHSAIAALANLPPPTSDESDEKALKSEHILDNFFASRTIRRLISLPTKTGGSSFAATLWKDALKGKCQTLASGHGAKIIAAVASCHDLPTKNDAVQELKPLVKKGLLKSIEKLLPEELQSLENAQVAEEDETLQPKTPQLKAGSTKKSIKAKKGVEDSTKKKKQKVWV